MRAMVLVALALLLVPAVSATDLGGDEEAYEQQSCINQSGLKTYVHVNTCTKPVRDLLKNVLQTADAAA